MEFLIIAVLVLLVGALLLWRRAQQPRSKPQTKTRPSNDALDTVAAWPPQVTRILTVAERKAYASLRSALPDHMILAQVPLSRFMKVPTRNSYSEWLRRVGLMTVDLVVCDSDSQVVAVVDIRAFDKESPRGKQRHARMDRVLQAANIRVHVWPEDAIPNATAARNAILAAPKELSLAESTLAARKAPPLIRDVPNPIEPEALLDAEISATGTAHRDPPPSTWFDNLDSAAVPLGAPAAPPAPTGLRPR